MDPSDFEEVKVYDGELNSMTFNHIKTSKAFNSFKLNVDDDLSWLHNNDLSTTIETNEESSSIHTKKSEDGWNNSLRR